MGYFSSTVAAVLKGQVVRCDALVFFDFLTAPMRLWMGNGTLHTADGHDWNGIGQLGAIGDIESALGGTSPQIEFTLSGVDTSLVSDALDASNEVNGRDVTIYLQFFYEDFQPLDLPYAVWIGTMDVMRIKQVGPLQCSMTVTAETIFARRALPPLGYLTDRDQQRLFPGDPGLIEVPNMISKVVIWPVILPQ